MHSLITCQSWEVSWFHSLSIVRNLEQWQEVPTTGHAAFRLHGMLCYSGISNQKQLLLTTNNTLSVEYKVVGYTCIFWREGRQDWISSAFPNQEPFLWKIQVISHLMWIALGLTFHYVLDLVKSPYQSHLVGYNMYLVWACLLPVVLFIHTLIFIYLSVHTYMYLIKILKGSATWRSCDVHNLTHFPWFYMNMYFAVCTSYTLKGRAYCCHMFLSNFTRHH